MRPFVIAMLLTLGVATAACAKPPPPQPPATDPLDAVTADELYLRGLQAQEAGDAERAEQYLAAALERGFPVDVGMPALLSACVAAESYDSALHHALAQLERTPDDWSLRLVTASLALALGDEVTARDQLEHILAQVPDQPEALDLLATLQ